MFHTILNLKKYDLVVLSGGNTIIKYSKLNKDKFREKINSFFLILQKNTKFQLLEFVMSNHFIASKYKLNLKKIKVMLVLTKLKIYLILISNLILLNHFMNIKLNLISQNL